MGPKTFEQAAGFLRIRDTENPLDGSAVHPESYPVVEMMAKDLSCTVSDLIKKNEMRDKIILENYVTDTVGMPTLKDIIQELIKPGRDPRKEFEIFSFSDEVNDIKDLTTGMRLPGVITNVTAFGAFVDIGVHQDGLVHISQLSDSFVKNLHDTVKVHQKVMVTVLDIDLERKRISLSMKQNLEPCKTSEDKNVNKKDSAAGNRSKKKNPVRDTEKSQKGTVSSPVSPFAELAEKWKNK